MKRSLIILILLLLSPSLSARSRASRDLDSLMRSYGMVDLQQLSPEIRVDLKYATTDNFTGVLLYRGLKRAYLEPSFARRVARAQSLLSRLRPGYRLIVFDAARPQSVQREMRRRVEGTPLAKYVAPASKGGRHNYGVAVDLSIVDDRGQLLDMGTPFDHLGPEATVGDEERWIKAGKMKPEVRANRRLLIEVMRQAGMRPYRLEWWHFQELIPMSQVRQRYRLLDF